MLRRLFAATPLLLLVATLLAPAADAATSNTVIPTPFALEGPARSPNGGVQRAWKVQVSEDRALDAVFKGGMWLPDAAGGRIYARYAKHILNQDGSWTWIGKVATAQGDQSVVITFGKDAVFGRIPRTNGYPLRLETEHGTVLLVQTSGVALQHSAALSAMPLKSDARPVPRPGEASSAAGSTMASSSVAQANSGAASTGTHLIDVMVAYTPGIVSEYGSQSAALTRIHNLVALANQAYADSQVNLRIRLVNAVEVNYPDNTSNDSALDDITGYDDTGKKVPIPASLQQIASLRLQYGADLVSLLRKYDSATNGSCGQAWLIGTGGQPIDPGADSAYGYSVVSDGNGCLDTRFAHELGHNMGNAHDRANAQQPGAYPYSYGYKSSSATGFATIMAYGDPQQQPIAIFSNPDIALCQNQPCGVADGAPDSADNAHSMNNTAYLISQFEPVKIAIPPGYFAPTDVNGDGDSDLLWRSQSGSQMAYWILNGSKVVRSQVFSASSGYHIAATGDFNGDDILDLVWTNGSAVYLWIGNGTGYVSQLVGYYDSRWQVVGAGDIDGDGKSDLLWHSPQLGSFGFWIMDGLKVLRQASFPISPAFRFAGTGDFNGDQKADVVWTDGYSVYAWLGNGSQFTAKLVGVYGAGWKLVGVGDVDGNGQSDLLFRNQGTASFAYWLLHNGSPVNSASFPAGSQFSIGAIGDFDGNGKTDVMWTNGAALYEWKSNGVGFASSYVANYGDGWTLIQTGETP